MCGIAGIVGKNSSKALAERMVRSIVHRGPDGMGVYSNGQANIGQTRLSIIDLNTGDQPMPNEDGTIWVVFNGEIYNFLSLRKELEEKGHIFSTTSDTEVILHGYEEYGVEIVKQLDGIFSIGLWDSNKNRLLMARDYFGVKPLYYTVLNDTIYFASEIKGILQVPDIPREVDYQAMHFFLNLRYIPGERTLFRGIKKFPPGHYGIYENNTLHINKYYQLSIQTETPKDENYYVDGIRHYLKKAVQKQMISDVPLGVSLSGGLDSSSIVAFMSEISNEAVRTFTLGFNEPTDELTDARVIADKFSTDHHETVLDFEPLKIYPKVIWHVEEPKENILQGYMLSKFIREHVKVIQGGLGGDELFAGYVIDQFIYPTRYLHKLVPYQLNKKLLEPISQFVFNLQNHPGMISWDEYRRGVQLALSLGNPLKYYLILRNTWDFDRPMWKNLYGPVMQNQGLLSTFTQFEDYFSAPLFSNRKPDILDRALYTEFHTKMVNDFLMNEDHSSSAHGLEIRVPFLDKDLVNFAMGIPSGLKIKHNQTKYIFKKAMRGILPEQTINKKKWGFTFNPYIQFQKDLKQVSQRVLTKKRVEELGWFNYSYIEQIISHQPHPRLRWHYFYLWLALGMHIWHDIFITGDISSPSFDLEHYYHV